MTDEKCEACEGIPSLTPWSEIQKDEKHHAFIARLRAEKEAAERKLAEVRMELELTHQYHGPKKRETCRGCRWLAADFAADFTSFKSKEKQ